jgi:hypothetical protein
LPFPQADPSAALPVAVHTLVPVAHEVIPSLQSAGVQAATTQSVQAPLLQTRLAPQAVPLATGVAPSTQVGVPPAQEIEPW